MRVRKRASRRRAVLAGALLVALPALGATVYKTVDAEGKVSYSDTPPPAGTPAEVIETRAAPDVPDAEAAARLEQMRETTDRLRADRLAREQERAQPYAPESYPSEPPYQAPVEQRWLVPYYPPYRYRPGDGHRPPPPPRPPLLEPEPLPSGADALSPRGLQARLRKAR